MSKTAEDVSAAVNTGVSRLNATDQIAELLISEDEAIPEDKKEDENLNLKSNLGRDEESDESEADGDETDEEESDEEETELKSIADDDLSWEGVIGLPEEQLSFDDNGNLKGIHVKVNDFEGTLTIPELVTGYQTAKAVTMKGQKQAEEYKVFADQKEQSIREYTSKIEAVDMLSSYFEKQIISEFDGINWEELRIINPAEYAAARHDFSAKAGELQRIKDAIAADKQSVSAEQQQAQGVAQQKYLMSQYDKMIANNPEWHDEKARNEAQAEFKAFVKDSYGFTENEFETIYDARLIELIKDAKKYREGTKVAQKKLTKPVPKFQKSRGKGVKPKVSKLEKLTAASRIARGSDKRDLQQSAVAELLLGGS
jgi:hypothetical protein